MTTSDPPRTGCEAVLFDKDGTLVVDVPYCSDPDLVQVMPTAPAALGLLREAGVPVGIVSNQSGIARGLISRNAAEAVFAEVERQLGPFATVRYCPHAPSDGCRCRKPRPGMLLDAAAELGMAPQRLAVVGDIGADVEAARAVGAASVLVPTPATRPEEVRSAPVVRHDLVGAVEYLLHGDAVGATG